MECPWKYALGKPCEGVHAKRICGLAAFDVLGTVGLGVGAAFMIRHRITFLVAIVPCIITAFLMGVILHWWFCVPTALNVWLGILS